MCGILSAYNPLSIGQCLTPLQPLGSPEGECLCGHALPAHATVPALPPRGGCVETGCPRFVTSFFDALAPGRTRCQHPALPPQIFAHVKAIKKLKRSSTSAAAMPPVSYYNDWPLSKSLPRRPTLLKSSPDAVAFNVVRWGFASVLPFLLAHAACRYHRARVVIIERASESSNHVRTYACRHHRIEARASNGSEGVEVVYVEQEMRAGGQGRDSAERPDRIGAPGQRDAQRGEAFGWREED
ncbi:hypothetical protein B0H10DRAFT_2218329 [Mycena sp. CBHHK59/15]|nr:hypothetical protein B0H10DRAFT_2231196 [Mycena sp. CBHHK59/15]KAJ6617779.1 hypothetical protein B0H10DRAFT_2218329 [Mycena sp. CBHHK59/15]